MDIINQIKEINWQKIYKKIRHNKKYVNKYKNNDLYLTEAGKEYIRSQIPFNVDNIDINGYPKLRSVILYIFENKTEYSIFFTPYIRTINESVYDDITNIAERNRICPIMKFWY